MIFRTKRGKLEVRFDDDIADLVIANVEATWRLRSVFTLMQELEESLVAQKPQAAHLETLRIAGWRPHRASRARCQHRVGTLGFRDEASQLMVRRCLSFLKPGRPTSLNGLDTRDENHKLRNASSIVIPSCFLSRTGQKEPSDRVSRCEERPDADSR